MTGAEIAFWGCAFLAVLPALMVLIGRDIVRMAFWLLASFLGVAGLYLLLGADFLAVTQVMVYVGGILVLILFGLMLTRKESVLLAGSRAPEPPPQLLPGLAVAALTTAVLAHVIFSTRWHLQPRPSAPTTARLGDLLMTDFLLPFEIASVLLLVALVGAAFLVRRPPRNQED